MNKLALFALALIVTASSVALSDENKAPPTDEEVVHAAVLRPLLERHRERAMFSRARIRTPDFKLRLERALHVDAAGAQFKRFRVLRDDQPHLEGCLYPGERGVFLRTLGVEKPSFVPADRHPGLKGGGLPIPGLARDKPTKQRATPPRADACVEAPPQA